MKRVAGRRRDLDGVEALEQLAAEEGDMAEGDMAAGTREGAEEAQRRAWRATTAEQRLLWLEDALTLAAATGSLARDRRRRAREATALARVLGLEVGS
jgi:hypothetical protein